MAAHGACRPTDARCRARFGAASPSPLDHAAVAGRPAEHRRRQLVLLQQTVELGAVAVGDAGGVGDVAVGQLEKLHQVVALEALLCLGVGQRFDRRHAQGALDQGQRNQRRRRQRAGLLDDVVELADVARPGGAGERLESLGGDAGDRLAVLAFRGQLISGSSLTSVLLRGAVDGCFPES